MIDISVRAGEWTAHFVLRRASAENYMDWNERAKKRAADRETYKESIRDSGPALVRFLIPSCFDEIVKQLNAEVSKCKQDVALRPNYEGHTVSIEKAGYPRAALAIEFQTPEGMPFTRIKCVTTGLGANNERTSLTVSYDIKMKDGAVVYRRIGAVGGPIADFSTVADLVDDILIPFAECIA